MDNPKQQKSSNLTGIVTPKEQKVFTQSPTRHGNM